MAGKSSQWLSRLTGFSTPIFGASWTSPAAERDVATELLLHLEDRRVLFSPSEAEVPHHCVSSVLELRRILSDALVKTGGSGVLADHVRAMGAASSRFLDRIGNDRQPDYEAMRSPGHYLSWEFLDALGQMRGIIGVHIAAIAARYDLEVQGALATVLPVQPLSDDLEERRGW